MCPTIYILSKNYCATLRSMNRWIMLNRGRQNHHLYLCVSWNRGCLYVSNIFEHFEHLRTSFICFLCSFIHSPPRFIHVPSAFIRFQTVWTGSYFHLFSSFFQTHLLEISFLNVPSAISRRSQFVPISVSVHVRPSSGHHHPLVFDYPRLSVTIQWFWSG